MSEFSALSRQDNLSVVIITLNEEHAIAECLASVAWADEIIVVDSGSTDKTLEICSSYGAVIHCTTEWHGFGYQKNLALSLATKDWVLSLDADERVSDELRAEIIEAINSDKDQAVYRIPRRSSYCGQFIKHSGWSPDYVVRLFPRLAAKFTDDIVHENVIFSGKLHTVKHPILHISYVDLEEVLNKTNRYSTDGAVKLYNQGKRSSLSKAVLRGFWAFLRTYFLRLGFLDGRMGFVLAVSNAQTTYYRYLKLMLLNQKK
jgi:glycosyltransferase involved in cell wall biosynthesis